MLKEDLMAVHTDHHPHGKYHLTTEQRLWAAAPLLIIVAFLLWTIIASQVSVLS